MPYEKRQKCACVCSKRSHLLHHPLLVCSYSQSNRQFYPERSEISFHLSFDGQLVTLLISTLQFSNTLSPVHQLTSPHLIVYFLMRPFCFFFYFRMKTTWHMRLAKALMISGGNLSPVAVNRSDALKVTSDELPIEPVFEGCKTCSQMLQGYPLFSFST